MNIRLLTIIIFILIILGGLGLFFMNEKNTQELTERISPAVQETEGSTLQNTTVRSSDNRVSFQYPSSWSLNETTDQTQKGQFGRVMQSWSVQNYPLTSASPSGISDSNVKVEIVIQSGGSNMSIDDIVDCGMKTITCEKIGIDNEQFIRSESVLNTGMTNITVGTFYDDKVLTANATITPGQDMQSLKNTVNSILTSFKFSNNTSVGE